MISYSPQVTVSASLPSQVLPSLFQQEDLSYSQHHGGGGEDCISANVYPICAITTTSSVYTNPPHAEHEDRYCGLLPRTDFKRQPEPGGRRHSTPATLIWLDQHYHLSDGICIPRNSVYFNYVDFCSKNKMIPVNAASFGKVSVGG